MCCTDIPNVCVLDVEGTDGAEVVRIHLFDDYFSAQIGFFRQKANAVLTRVAFVCSACPYLMCLSLMFMKTS
jgi:hypothetical protein